MTSILALQNQFCGQLHQKTVENFSVINEIQDKFKDMKIKTEKMTPSSQYAVLEGKGFLLV